MIIIICSNGSPIRRMGLVSASSLQGNPKSSPPDSFQSTRLPSCSWRENARKRWKSCMWVITIITQCVFAPLVKAVIHLECNTRMTSCILTCLRWFMLWCLCFTLAQQEPNENSQIKGQAKEKNKMGDYWFNSWILNSNTWSLLFFISTIACMKSSQVKQFSLLNTRWH